MPGRVLIVQSSANLDGSAVSGLMLADGLRELGWETHVAFAFDGAVIPHYRAHGHRTYLAPHKSWLRSSRHLHFARIVLQEIRAAGAVVELLDRVKPDVVYVNTAASLAGAVAAARRGVPCVWHMRELFAEQGGELRVPGGLKPLVRTCLSRLATRLVVNSMAVAEHVLGEGDRAGAAVVPNAVDSSFFLRDPTRSAAREALGVSGERRVIGVPGTLRPLKGHPFCFRALRPLLAERPDVELLVSGGGAAGYRAELEALLEELGLSRSVRFLGSMDDMRPFYRACDLVCIPSASESFGRTVIEAFAAGTPVAATAVGGIPEIVTDGVDGLLVDYGDERALEAAVRRLLDDDRLRGELRGNARAVAEREYHESTYKARIGRIVCEAAGGLPARVQEPVPAE